MNNNDFRKTIENISKHKDIKLMTSRGKYVKFVIKPNLKDGYPFLKEFIAAEMGKTEIEINKLVYLK